MAKSLKNMMGAGIGAGTATLINGTVADSLTATGSSQTDALILTSDVNVVSTVPVGAGVRLLAVPQPGDEVLISNLGANALAVYPPIGGTISGASVNSAFSLPAGAASEFVARNGSANWVALSSGTPTPTPTPTGTLAAPTLDYPSPIASNPASIAVHIPADWQSADALKLAYSSSSAMTSPTVLSHAITDTDVTNGSATVSIPTLAGTKYFQGYGNHAGADSANLSNIVAWGDTTAPAITTSGTQSAFETAQLAIALTGTDAGGIASWSIVGGPDQLQFQIVGTTLEWVGNGSQSLASPNDQGFDNVYNVTVQATDYSGNSSTLAIAVTVNAVDQTPDPFTFTNVSNATHSTVYTSNTVTLSGLQPGFNIPASLSGTGFTYSKNGGAYQAPGSFTVQNGDTLTLEVISGATDSITEAATIIVGTYSTGWSVATPGSAATLTIGTGATGAGVNRSRYVNVASPGFQFIMNNNPGQNSNVWATLFAASTKFQLEINLDNWASGGSIWFGFGDGSIDWDNTTGAVSGAALPGNSGVAGISMGASSGATSLFVFSNADGGNASPAMTALAAAQKIILAVDKTAQTIELLQNGTLIQTYTLTVGTLTNWKFFIGGATGTGVLAASDAATTNFGLTAFAYPQAGYSFYA